MVQECGRYRAHDSLLEEKGLGPLERQVKGGDLGERWSPPGGEQQRGRGNSEPAGGRQVLGQSRLEWHRGSHRNLHRPAVRNAAGGTKGIRARGRLPLSQARRRDLAGAWTRDRVARVTMQLHHKEQVELEQHRGAGNQGPAHPTCSARIPQRQPLQYTCPRMSDSF